jgi:hypothetical protein
MRVAVAVDPTVTATTMTAGPRRFQRLPLTPSPILDLTGGGGARSSSLDDGDNDPIWLVRLV